MLIMVASRQVLRTRTWAEAAAPSEADLLRDVLNFMAAIRGDIEKLSLLQQHLVTLHHASL